MAVLESATKRYIGLSTDEKPPVASFDEYGAYVETQAVPPGSSFLETDTWRIARYDGERWQYDAVDSDVTERLDSVIALLRAQNDLLEALVDRL